jgi:hypothetical protein
MFPRGEGIKCSSRRLTGLRFMALPSRNARIGVDAAAGKGDYGIYFRIGEEF